MKNKWYRSKVTKMVLVIAEHIFIMLMIVSIFSMLALPSIAEEIVKCLGENLE